MGVRRQNGLEFLNRAIQVAGADVFHRQTVTRKRVGGIVGQEPP